jgi:HK97 family phage major capsid protein
MNRIEAGNALRQFGGASLKLPSNIHEVAQLRHKTKEKATALNDLVTKANREFTDAEKLEFDCLMDVLTACSAKLDRKDANGYRYGEDLRVPIPGAHGQDRRDSGDVIWDSDERRREPMQETEEVREAMKAITACMGTGRFLATDTPLNIQQAPVDAGLAAAINVTIVDALRAYYLPDSFALAGSTIYNTDNTAPLIKPVIQAGPDAEAEVESATSTDSHPMDVESFTFGGVKYSRLVKASHESLMNSALDLGNEIVSELAASVVNTFTKVTTAACLAALEGNPGCFVYSGRDPYAALSGLIAAVPPRFADASNCFMGSRADKLVVNNSRDTQGRPLFDQESNLTLGYRWIINDNLGRVIFGDFRSGAFVRKSPFFMQRLIEAYASAGQIGFRATQWLDSKFLASVHSVLVQPLYFTNLDASGS